MALVAEQFCPESQKNWTAYACAEDRTIGINQDEMNRPIEELQNDLLHEMIHLFVCWATPRGRQSWGDGTRIFRKLCEDFGARP